MSTLDLANKAEEASKEAMARIYTCLDRGQHFRLEAGAGAGKTYSLIKTLKYLIDTRGHDLIRRNQKIACLTYTNIAKDEIESRTDRHPVIVAATIHAFCWNLIKDFQPFLRDQLPTLNAWRKDKWHQKLEQLGSLANKKIDYDLGYRIVREDCIMLGHDDVLSLMVRLIENNKFRNLLAVSYPYIFIDEYQDTDKQLADALEKHLLCMKKGPVVGLFGDHWQKIYAKGCGIIEHPDLEEIPKGSNFRSVEAVVNVLNKMRPKLQQATSKHAEGQIAVYHTNSWSGERRTGNHWKGDLPPEIAHDYLESLRIHLASKGWNFSSNETKILMLTHNVLAKEQGYEGISQAFRGKNESFIKKEDRHIEFLVDIVEPACIAYQGNKFGEMFNILGRYTPKLHSHSEKISWSDDMKGLIKLRNTGSIGSVLDYLREKKRIRLPAQVLEKEKKIVALASEEQVIPELSTLRRLRDVPYKEIIYLSQFLSENTLFSTKHGVKGAEFENVLVVAGRGWNQYDFNQMLEWFSSGTPSNKKEAFERNRNLFYVACSRPKKRLAILFTQSITDKAMTTLNSWFGQANIYSVEPLSECFLSTNYHIDSASIES